MHRKVIVFIKISTSIWKKFRQIQDKFFCELVKLGNRIHAVKWMNILFLSYYVSHCPFHPIRYFLKVFSSFFWEWNFCAGLTSWMKSIHIMCICLWLCFYTKKDNIDISRLKKSIITSIPLKKGASTDMFVQDIFKHTKTHNMPIRVLEKSVKSAVRLHINASLRAMISVHKQAGRIKKG